MIKRRKLSVSVSETPLTESEKMAARKAWTIAKQNERRIQAEQRDRRQADREALCEQAGALGHVYDISPFTQSGNMTCVGCGKPKPSLLSGQ
jgi:hypothetical protein